MAEKKNLSKITITFTEKIENWSFFIQNSNFLSDYIAKSRQSTTAYRISDEENFSIFQLKPNKSENKEMSIESFCRLKKILQIFYHVREKRQGAYKRDIGLLDPGAFF